MEVLFFLIGVLVFGLGVYLLYDHINYVRIAMETTGKVVGFEVSESSKTKIYKPVVESYFGTFTSNYGSSTPGYDVGERLEVLYIAGKEPRIKSKLPYMLGVGLMIFGSIFCGIFISVFSFTTYHFVSSLLVFGIFGAIIRRKLKANGIDSMDELKEKIKAKQIQKEETTERIITDAATIQQSTETYQNTAKFVGPVFAVVGLGIVGLGIYLAMERNNFLQQAIPAVGTVIDFYESRSDDGYTYYPIVEYSPKGSFAAITFRHDIGSNPPSYRTGETVNVLHLPDNPNDAIIDKGIFNWTTSIFVTLFGSLFALVGFGVSISVYKRKKKQASRLSISL